MLLDDIYIRITLRISLIVLIYRNIKGYDIDPLRKSRTNRQNSKKMGQTSKVHVLVEQLFVSLYHPFNVSRETFFSKIQILVWQSFRNFSMNSEILFGRML